VNLTLRPSFGPAFRLLLLLLLVAAIAGACGGSGTSQLASSTGGAATDQAPDFPAGQTWFNVSKPLTIADLRGKVVVLDFWTLGCINCQHVIPDLNHLESEFGDSLAIVGVHSGKYDREHADNSVKEAILRLGIEHPVVNDPDFAIWSEYGAQAWPTDVVIDPDGKIVGSREGEGIYDALEPTIKQLVSDFDAKGQIVRTPLPIDLLAAPIASNFLSFPGDVLADPAGGRLFIADSDNNRILISDMNGALQKAIGSGTTGLKDGPSSQAEFNQPQGLALSADGNTLYVADTRNHALRAVDLATGKVTTLAGNGQRAQGTPAPGAAPTATSLASPWGLQLLGSTLYIAMAGSHQIWSLDLATNTLSVTAGSGAEGKLDQLLATATLAQPNEITTDGTDLYWVDPESSSVRHLSFADGDVTTLVGTGLFAFGDADGLPGIAKLQHAQGIVYWSHNLFVSDTYNHKIRAVNLTTGEVTTVWGTGSPGDVDGQGKLASFDEPGGLSTANGKLYLADTNNNAIRVIGLTSGTVTTLQLSNLAVAASGQKGRVLKMSLPPQTINPSTTTLRLKLTAPAGYLLNNLAPSQLTLSTSDMSAFSPGQTDVTFSTNEASVEVSVPVTAKEGQAILSAAGQVYYCRENENAICLVDQLDIALPVTVSAAAPAGDAVMQYELPQ
jgi:DNA-binding beta-propeller fold protein YncE